jgi:hypothetical protein
VSSHSWSVDFVLESEQSMNLANQTKIQQCVLGWTVHSLLVDFETMEMGRNGYFQ